MYRQRAFDGDIIELCVRWYITYRLSYRDLAEMMAERGIEAAHTTVLRWVIRHVPEVEKRCGRFSKPVGTLRRVDETHVPIKGQWRYLYRAVGKHGKTVDFLLRPDRGIAAVLAFFRKAHETPLPQVPRKGTLDGHVPSHRSLWLRRREHPCWRNVKVRSRKHLNNIIVRSSGAAPPWPDASRSPTPPSRSRALRLRIACRNVSSPSDKVGDATAGCG
jgi:transposase-like protein